LQARLLLNRVRYTGAPSRSLYDLLVQRAPNARQRYYVNVGRREVVESLGRCRSRFWLAKCAPVSTPIGARLDLEGEISRLNYTDGNIAPPSAPACSTACSTTSRFYVLAGYRRDDTRFQSPLYYTPQNFNTLAALADSHHQHGPVAAGLSPRIRCDKRRDDNRPARTLFGYYDYNVSDLVTLFINGGIVDAPRSSLVN
jgi:hypothetical protein